MEDSMVNITTFSLNWKQMGNGFFSILEWILRRSPTFWGRLKIKRCTRNTIYHMIYYIIIIYKCGPCPVFDELYNWGKNTEKTSVRVSQYTITIQTIKTRNKHHLRYHNKKKPQSQITIQNITIHITISETTHFTVYCNQKP